MPRGYSRKGPILCTGLADVWQLRVGWRHSRRSAIPRSPTRLVLLMIHLGPRMQSNLSTIDVCADALPQPARENWHNPSLDNIQRPRNGALVDGHAM
jgi:hypothetical protein